ncbi:MAG: InlB B-repeat-containing protein [Clostridia bacterium]|nr:InlB B-repeat-containing protein [Clostridia bacterium]
MYELKRHKKSDKIKWIFTSITFLLISVMLVGFGLQLFGTGKLKPSEWFTKSNTEEVMSGNVENEMTATSSVTPLSMAVSTTVEPRANNYSLPSWWNEGNGPVTGYYCISSNVGNLNDFVGCVDLRSTEVFGKSEFDGYDNAFIFTAPSFDGYSVKKLSVDIYGCSYDPGNGRCPSMPWNAHSDYCEFTPNSFYDTLKYSFECSSIGNDRYTCGEFYNPWRDAIGMYIDSLHFLFNIEYEFAKEPIPLPDSPVKEGYTFVGWYYDEAFTKPYDNKPIFEDTNLYAKFEINRYNVTFNSNDGSDVASQVVDWNTVANLTTPTRDGYAFKGWYLSDGTQYTNQPIKSNTTLTAHWERNRFTVTFNTDGGSEIESQTVSLNASVQLSTTTKKGFNFVGWFLQDGTEYTNQPITDDIELTARWEVIICTVTFYVDGKVYEVKEVEYGTALSEVVEVASTMNLQVMSLSLSDDTLIGEVVDEMNTVIGDLDVTVAIMNGKDKIVNTVKNNKWAVVGGLVGIVVLIVVVMGISSSVKRRKR